MTISPNHAPIERIKAEGSYAEALSDLPSAPRRGSEREEVEYYVHALSRSKQEHSRLMDVQVVLPTARKSSFVPPVFAWSWVGLVILALTAGVAIGASLFGGKGLAPATAVFCFLGTLVLVATLYTAGKGKPKA